MTTRLAGFALCWLALLLPLRAQESPEDYEAAMSQPEQAAAELGGGVSYERYSLAVVPFALVGEATAQAEWNRCLLEDADHATLLASEVLADMGYFELIDVARLRELRSELERPLVGALPSDVAQRVGEEAEVDFVVMGEVRRAASLSWKRRHSGRTGVLEAEAVVTLSVYDVEAKALIYRDVASAHARARQVQPPREGQPAELPAQPVRELRQRLRQGIGERLIEAIYPVRVERIREDGGLVLDRGQGGYLVEGVVLDVVGQDAAPGKGQVRVEAVAPRKSLGRSLGKSAPLPGARLRRAGSAPPPPPAPPPEPAAVAAAAPASGPGEPSRRSRFLLYAVLGVIGLLTLPLLVTAAVERRRQPRRTPSERIRVSADTVERKRPRRRAADAWSRRMQESELGSTVVHETRSRPRAARSDDWLVKRKLQVHAVGDEPSEPSEAGSLDLDAMAAEAPAGSYAYAATRSRFRNLVEDAWGESQLDEDPLDEPVIEAEELAAGADGEAVRTKTRASSTRVKPPRQRRSQASRRLDDLLG